jgi:hypothetical protein
VTKAIDKTSQDDTAMVPFEPPPRVEPSLPDNAITTESLCNAGDIVLRGAGKSFQTNVGIATPVFVQLLDHYLEHGPTPLQNLYLENGDAYLTGKGENGEEYPSGIYQFLTSSVVILRAANKITDQGVENNARGLLCAIETKVSAAGNRYYVLV